MINTLRPAMTYRALTVTALFMVSVPAFSQAPTEAQRSAIRSECRSDYMAHCSSVPPGGIESLQCLQKNMSSLAPGCQSAVRAVEVPAPKAESQPAAAPREEAAPATEKTEPAPAKPAAATASPPAAPKTESKAAASTAVRKPSSAQISAVRSACRSDYQKVCAGVPTGGAPALQCLEKNKSKLSASCEKAVASAGGGAGAPAAGGAAAGAAATAAPAAAPAAVPAAPTVIVLRPMLPREEFFVLRSACGRDVRALCGGVPAGGGRIMQCLAAQAASLSPECMSVLGQFAAQ